MTTELISPAIKVRKWKVPLSEPLPHRHTSQYNISHSAIEAIWTRNLPLAALYIAIYYVLSIQGLKIIHQIILNLYLLYESFPLRYLAVNTSNYQPMHIITSANKLTTTYKVYLRYDYNSGFCVIGISYIVFTINTSHRNVHKTNK